MPLSHIEVTDTYVEIGSGIARRIAYTSLLGATQDEKATNLQDLLQFGLDVKIKVRDLADDDPNKDTDPARPDLFWEGNGGNKDLVGRRAEALVRANASGTGGFDIMFRRTGAPDFFPSF